MMMANGRKMMKQIKHQFCFSEIFFFLFPEKLLATFSNEKKIRINLPSKKKDTETNKQKNDNKKKEIRKRRKNDDRKIKIV